MARYEHLPIFHAAYELAVHVEKIVRHFSRYHKYTLGTELRNKSRGIYRIRFHSRCNYKRVSNTSVVGEPR
ncbi:MAG: hypothetical protein JW850_05540 [Thermoflexales bacterium]|nr:hypothetical protein [Thermoflexales bacterium]